MDTLKENRYLSMTIKKYSELDLIRIFDKLYLECEHGDDEHRKWLKDKFNDFLEREISGK